MASATRSRAVAVSAHVSDIRRWSPLLWMGAITSHARVETRAAMLSLFFPTYFAALVRIPPRVRLVKAMTCSSGFTFGQMLISSTG